MAKGQFHSEALRLLQRSSGVRQTEARRQNVVREPRLEKRHRIGQEASRARLGT
jgi:hypothetical protein